MIWYVSVEFGVLALRVVRFEMLPLTSMCFGVFGCVFIESGVVWSVFVEFELFCCGVACFA